MNNTTKFDPHNLERSLGVIEALAHACEVIAIHGSEAATIIDCRRDWLLMQATQHFAANPYKSPVINTRPFPFAKIESV